VLSFIVPAHNEQAYLSRTLTAIHESARAVGQPYEVIVVDDASTDATAEIARQNNASVVSVNHRQIAATRNSGARAAQGERLFFVDADTTVNARALASALREMNHGAVGGGGPTRVGRSEVIPLYARLALLLGVIGPKLIGFTGGAFMFCTREAFAATGGYDERLFCAEEGAFALRLKREGRFAVLWQPVLTSGRRFRTMSGLQILRTFIRIGLSAGKMVTQRAAVASVWYDSNRGNDEKIPSAFAVRVSNGIALLIMLSFLSSPILGFVPWSLTPLSSPAGKLRFINATFVCHVGLFMWPMAGILAFNLLRQKHWTNVLQSLALIAFLSWEAWGATERVIWIWGKVYHWLA
jgi:glycosyltransferase involved in cell wall biosynthesis